jgi:hypothetical protein
MSGADAVVTSWSVVSIAVAVVAGLLTAAALGAGVGVARAGHGPEGSNFTYTPLSADDREPGASDTRVGQIGQAAAGVDTDFETLLRLRAVWRAGSWESCGPGSAEEFGIDRGSDNEPYTVDEGLTDNVKSFSAGEDSFESKFYDEDELGESVHLNSEDRVFSVIECPTNPPEAGWHRIDAASVKGRTAGGEVVTYEDPSHWFWICDCRNEAEARDRLGPPPSEPAETPIPTPTATERSTADGEPSTPTGTAATGTRRSTETGVASRETATPAATGDGPTTSRATGTPTPTPADWDDYTYRTPTVGSGGGFPPVAAIAALLVATALGRRWRRRD